MGIVKQTGQNHSPRAVHLTEHGRYFDRLIFQAMSLVTDHYVEVDAVQFIEMLCEHFVGNEQKGNVLGVRKILNFVLAVDLKCERAQRAEPLFDLFVPILNQRTGRKDLKEKCC